MEITGSTAHITSGCKMVTELLCIIGADHVKPQRETRPAWSFITVTLLFRKERALQWEHRANAAPTLAPHQLLAKEWGVA